MAIKHLVAALAVASLAIVATDADAKPVKAKSSSSSSSSSAAKKTARDDDPAFSAENVKKTKKSDQGANTASDSGSGINVNLSRARSSASSSQQAAAASPGAETPLMSTTLLLPGEDLPLTDAAEVQERTGHAVDVILDGGNCGLEPTTVVDLSGDAPVLLREGKGDPAPFR